MEQPEKQSSRNHEWKKWAVIPGSLIAVIAAEEAIRHNLKKNKNAPGAEVKNETSSDEQE